jgi:hypothetical protein
MRIRIQIQIQVFYGQKYKNVTFEKKFKKNIQYTSVKGIQTTGEASSPPKRTSSTSKHRLF